MPTEALCLKGCCEQTCAHKFKTFGSGEKVWGATNFYVNHHAFEVPPERLDGAQNSAAALHNGVGYLLGYWLARVAQLDQKSCRTVSFEVGMQNGGMGSGLAASMGKLSTMGLASAVFSPWMNISGSLLAYWWRRQTPPEQE